MTRFSSSLVLRQPVLWIALAAAACNTGDGDQDDDLLVDTGDDDTGTSGDDTGGGGDDDTGDKGHGKDDFDLSKVELPDPGDYDYSTSYTFRIEDVSGGFDGATQATDSTIVCLSGCEDQTNPKTTEPMFPIDNDFGFTVQDFVGASPSARDGVYDDGWIGPIEDADGALVGVRVGSVETGAYKTGHPLGRWCAGLGAELEKCSSEHYVSMESTLTCHETVPYLNFDPTTGAAVDPVWDVCEALSDDLSQVIADLEPYEDDLVGLAIGDDYAVSKKEDGKPLYHWGTWDKRPTDVRLTATMPLPTEWKQDGAAFTVTRAELAIVHTTSNSPNNQVRPEDLENENATGRKPAYDVQPDGTWTSAVDCQQSDGTSIPKGTVLKNPAFGDPSGASIDLVEGYTNAWYTTLDRDPFEADPVTGVGPRWRLKAPKFGQDIPGLEIPTENCAEQPVQKGMVKYPSGELTVTLIDLLDWVPGEDSPLALSTGWTAPNIQDLADAEAGLTVNGVVLTDDFDLSVYVKGEVKPLQLFKAVLYLDYEPVP